MYLISFELRQKKKNSEKEEGALSWFRLARPCRRSEQERNEEVGNLQVKTTRMIIMLLQLGVQGGKGRLRRQPSSSTSSVDPTFWQVKEIDTGFVIPFTDDPYVEPGFDSKKFWNRKQTTKQQSVAIYYGRETTETQLLATQLLAAYRPFDCPFRQQLGRM